MKNGIRMFTALVCAAAFICGICPCRASATYEDETENDIPGAVWIRDPAEVSGSRYTEDAFLAERLDLVFQGHAGLYTDYECTQEYLAPLGTYSVPNWGDMLNVPDNQRGWSCYIYANGVYYALFGECPGDATHEYRNSEVIWGVDGTPETLYYNFQAAGVISCGAYCRNYSHSFLILHYDANGIVLLDGNSINGYNGLVQVTEATWDYFWRYFLSAGENPIQHVVQPTLEYLSRLRVAEMGEILAFIAKPNRANREVRAVKNGW